MEFTNNVCRHHPVPVTMRIFCPQELSDETNKLSDTAQFLEQQCLPLYYAETPKDMNINANHSMNQKAGYLNMRFKVSNLFHRTTVC